MFANDEKKYKEANIDPLEAFSPSMTIGEMKLTLATALAEKAKEQDANAIDTDASIIDNDDTDASIIDNDEPMTLADWAINPKAYCEQIINDMTALKGLIEKDVKPEKLAILDGAIAYMKEVKKVIKK